MTPADEITRALSGERDAPPKLIAFLTGLFPDAQRFVELLLEISKHADLIEVGIPFSDPMADGSTIQRASQRVLKQGASFNAILECLSGMRRRIECPVVLMSYLNPILAHGLERAAPDAADAGVSGFIVPDLPFEECASFRRELGRHGLALIQLVSPVTPIDRLEMLCRESQGFVYAVAQTGTTGPSAASDPHNIEYFDSVRRASCLPVCAGFGIRTTADIRNLSEHVDGVVIGSALIDAIDAGKDAGEFLGDLRKSEP